MMFAFISHHSQNLIYRDKIVRAKPVVDTTSPSTYMHLQYKMKKIQVQKMYGLLPEFQDQYIYSPLLCTALILPPSP